MIQDGLKVTLCEQESITAINIAAEWNLTLYAPTLQNGKAHSNNLSTTVYKLFKCVWRFCGVGA